MDSGLKSNFSPQCCSHKKKRMKQVKKMMKTGQLLDADNEDPFALFLASSSIRYCYYAETHKILGQTFGMCVLQVRVFFPNDNSVGIVFMQSVCCLCLSFYASSHLRLQALADSRVVIAGQDFEALTPNLLARTVETVEGGGIILLLLSSLSSLSSLYTMVMVSSGIFGT